jgi:hypothetical protein
MKNVYLWTVCLLLTATGIHAQGLELGIKGGMTLPALMPAGKKTPLNEGYSSQPDWGTGIFGEYRINDRFSITVGLEYSGQSITRNGMQAISAQGVTINNLGTGPVADAVRELFPKNYLYLRYDNKITFDYLTLPVQVRIGWDFSPTSPWRVYVGAGLFASYFVNADQIVKGTSHYYSDRNGLTLREYAAQRIDEITTLSEENKRTVLDIYKHLDESTRTLDSDADLTDTGLRPFIFGAIGHAGISRRFGGHHRLFIEVGGQYGLQSVQKKVTPNDRRNRAAAGSLMLGYSFALGQ